MQIGFGVHAGKVEKLDHVGVTEDLECGGMSLFEDSRNLCGLGDAAFEKRSLELAFEFAL